MKIPNWLRKILGLPDPTLVDPTVADLQARLAAAEAAAATSRLHALDATRQLQQSIPAPLSPGVASSTANVATAPNPPAPTLAAADAGNVTTATAAKADAPAQPAAGSTQTATDVSSPQAAAQSAPAAQPSQGENVEPLKGEQLVRMMVEQAAGYDDPILRAELGSMRGPYVDAYETGAGPMGVDIGKLRTAAVYPSWWVLMQGASNPTSAKNVAAVQVLLDQGAIKGGGSLDGFAGV